MSSMARQSAPGGSRVLALWCPEAKAAQSEAAASRFAWPRLSLWVPRIENIVTGSDLDLAVIHEYRLVA